MNKLKIYHVNDKYIKYLYNVDQRVMYNKGKNNSNKRVYTGVIGVKIEQDNIEYIAPLTSPKLKHNKISDKNPHIVKLKNGELGYINLNNAIPVVSGAFEYISLSDVDKKYKLLLQNQIIELEKHSKIIEVNEKFEKLYNSSKKTKNVVDFKLLEKAYYEYNIINNNLEKVLLDNNKHYNDKDTIVIKENKYNDSELYLRRYLHEIIYYQANSEGTSSTFPETASFLEGNDVSTMKNYDVQVILGLKRAWEFILNTKGEDVDFEFISKVNLIVSDPTNERPGMIRNSNVYILDENGKRIVPEIPIEFDVRDKIYNINKIDNPIEKSFEFFSTLSKAQVFHNCNKRTSFLVASKILIENDLGLLYNPLDKNLDVEYKNSLTRFYKDDSKKPELYDFLLKSCFNNQLLDDKLGYENREVYDVKQVMKMEHDISFGFLSNDNIGMDKSDSAWEYIVSDHGNDIYSLEYITKLNDIVLKNGEFQMGSATLNQVDNSKIEMKMEEIKNIIDPVDRAIEVIITGINNQYFYDGNKRTSLMLANSILIEENIGLIVVKDVDFDEFNKHLAVSANEDLNFGLTTFIRKKCIDYQPDYESKLDIDRDSGR